MNDQQAPAPVTITELVCTCEITPVQLEGRLSNGLYLYARSRFGHVRVSVSDTEQGAVLGETSLNATVVTNPWETHGGFHCISESQLRVYCEWFVSVIDWRNRP